ncbi:MAG: hypothetical protein AAF805_15460, partial [Planctomycetota bacterium]
FTTIAGFMPLILGGGGFWPPMAVTIAGGVGGATLLALVLAPSGYLALMCRGRGKEGGTPADEPSTAATDDTDVDLPAAVTSDTDETPLLVAHAGRVG